MMQPRCFLALNPSDRKTQNICTYTQKALSYLLTKKLAQIERTHTQNHRHTQWFTDSHYKGFNSVQACQAASVTLEMRETDHKPGRLRALYVNTGGNEM